jgi:hypothetical protein
MQWCKDRAIQLLNSGDINGAFNSMMSDVMKHPETEHHASTNQLGTMLLMAGCLSLPAQMRDWILGYN